MISIIIPSMYRLELLKKAVDSVFETAGGLDLEVIIVADEDKETFDLSNTLKMRYRRILTTFNPVRMGKINSPNIGLKLANGDMLFHMMDDAVLYPNALQSALFSHKALGGFGMVGFNDLNQHVVCTTTLFDRKFCKEVLGGVMLCPHYKSYFADNENQEKAIRSGHFFYNSTAICEHLHSSNGKRPLTRYELDETKYWDQDETTLNVRRATNFPNDFESIV